MWPETLDEPVSRSDPVIMANPFSGILRPRCQPWLIFPTARNCVTFLYTHYPLLHNLWLVYSAGDCNEEDCGAGSNAHIVQDSQLRTHLAMECPWLALEVLRELEDAGAHYFALTLLSPRSRNYLVSV